MLGMEIRQPLRLTTAAAKFNRSVLRKLTAALEKDPEVDLITVFPTGYRSRLEERKSQAGTPIRTLLNATNVTQG